MSRTGRTTNRELVAFMSSLAAVITLALAACAAPGPAATPTSSPRPTSTPTPRPTPTSTPEPTATPTLDVQRTAALKTYLDKNFGKPQPTQSYMRVRDVKVFADNTVTVETDLKPTEGRAEIISICTAISNAKFEGMAALGLITVIDQAGKKFNPPGEHFYERCNGLPWQ